MDRPIIGRCFCAAVTLRVSAPADMMINCHCRNCQHLTGSAFATIAFFPKHCVDISGMLSTFEYHNESGHKLTRYFCPTCATTMAQSPARFPDKIGIPVGICDETNWFHPDHDVFLDSAMAWEKDKSL